MQMTATITLEVALGCPVVSVDLLGVPGIKQATVDKLILLDPPISTTPQLFALYLDQYQGTTVGFSR